VTTFATTFHFNFDRWREEYDSLSFEDQQEAYEHVARMFPNQRSFDVVEARKFIARYQPKTVVELGGWDDALANSLGAFRSWTNYDLVEVPQACAAFWYELVVLQRPFWEDDYEADAFVATHTIEHLRARELESLVQRLRVKACLIEAPLRSGPTDWKGYRGTHILEVGWEGVDAIFANSGFRVDERWSSGRFYSWVSRAQL
jgi:hypothetical protein